MRKKITPFLFISALLHLLLFGGFVSYGWLFLQSKPIPESEARQGAIIPGYAYQLDQLPRPEVKAAEASSEPQTAPEPKAEQKEEPLVADAEGIFPKAKLDPKPLQAPSREPSAKKNQQAEKPISVPNLISDSKIDKPLLKLLSRATSEKLIYPKSAGDFGVHGKATIGFVIFPSGELSDITLLESSGSGVLDQAALDAIHAIAPVAGVDRYLHASKYLVVGIIFS